MTTSERRPPKNSTQFGERINRSPVFGTLGILLLFILSGRIVAGLKASGWPPLPPGAMGASQ